MNKLIFPIKWQFELAKQGAKIISERVTTNTLAKIWIKYIILKTMDK